MWQIALTRQEKGILLFFIGLWLLGYAAEEAVRSFPRAERFISGEFARFDVNTVTADELIESRCITEKLARKIVEDRQLNGPFRSVNELMRVKGIGEYRYRKLKDFFYVSAFQ